MRALVRTRAAGFGSGASLTALGTIELTNAAPDMAQALATAISAHGGTAQIISRPSGNGICLVTEALSGAPPAERHHAALMAALHGSRAGARTCVLDYSHADVLADLGGAAGLCRTVRIEHPSIRAFALSLDVSAGPGANAERVVHALLAPEDDYVLAADGCWGDAPGPELPPPVAYTALPTSPVWLVTGGGRGVTADCTVELARRIGGTFFLLGRSGLTEWPEGLPFEADLKALRGLLARNASQPGMPKKPVEIDQFARRLLASAEIAGTLEAIAAAGGRAHYLQADIGDTADVQRAIGTAVQSAGAITGLVHGAGVLSDGRSEALTLADFETVFSPKVHGLETILSCIDLSALSHVGLFSSASAVFGNTGQANYAAANGWLNAVAERLALALPGAQVKSFCWGPWQGGMVDEALARMFTERGIALISRAEGARIFADMLLNAPADQVRFVIGDEWGAA